MPGERRVRTCTDHRVGHGDARVFRAGDGRMDVSRPFFVRVRMAGGAIRLSSRETRPRAAPGPRFTRCFRKESVRTRRKWEARDAHGALFWTQSVLLVDARRFLRSIPDVLRGNEPASERGWLGDPMAKVVDRQATPARLRAWLARFHRRTR